MSACMRGEDRCFGDGESSGGASALFIIFEDERTGDVLLAGAGTLHGSQDDSVLQIGGSNADGLEQLWDARGHLGMWGCEV
jgi:hypothetical protein